MNIKFDIEAIENDPSLNMLTWEVIEARGIPVGDLVMLFGVAVAMGESAAACVFESANWDLTYIRSGMDENASHVSQTYALLAKFLAHDAREIVKFLMARGFEFPDGATGKRDDEDFSF